MMFMKETRSPQWTYTEAELGSIFGFLHVEEDYKQRLVASWLVFRICLLCFIHVSVQFNKYVHTKEPQALLLHPAQSISKPSRSIHMLCDAMLNR